MAFHVHIDLRLEGYGQYTSTTCWYAAYRLLYQWSERSETSIPGRLGKQGLDYQRLRLRGLLDAEYGRAAGALGMGGWSGQKLSSYSADSIGHILKQYGPLWLATSHAGSGHAVVVGGYDGDSRQFRIYDPFNKVFGGTVDTGWLTAKQLKERVQPVPFAAQVCT